MQRQRPQRCNARRRRSEAALYRADREGRPLMEYLRSSTWCRNWPVRGKKRCRLHGGFSTGPRTPEGKARTIAASRRLLEKLKAEGKPVPWGRKRGGVNRSAAERQLARATEQYARARRDLEAFLSQKFPWQERRQSRRVVKDGLMPWSEAQVLQDRLREADDALERAQVEAAEHKRSAHLGRSE